MKAKRGKSFPRPEKRAWIVDGEKISRRGIYALYKEGKTLYFTRGRVVSSGEYGGIRLSQSVAMHYARETDHFPRVAPRASKSDPEARK